MVEASFVPRQQESFQLHRLRRSASNSFPEKTKSPALAQLPQNQVVVEVCDANNNPHNYFIYCSGKLLEAVMEHHLFNDSKTFVDMPMRYDAKIVERKFDKQFPMSVAEVPVDKLKEFMKENFLQEGTELLKCELSDWKARPILLERIQDKTLREWSFRLNDIWKVLCRKMDPTVEAHPSRYSLLYVPKPFVVPGGRFREFYYWDAYWIIKGLLASGMHATCKHMIQNFVHMVETYGFVPNGGRVYYLRRSQPPILTGMVYEYFEATHDVEFIREIMPKLEMELEFWDRKRLLKLEISGAEYEVYQYRTESNVPRPESYREDIDLVKQLTKPEEKRQIWQDLASAAESGWDFSSRWLNDSVNLRTIQTTSIVPVDLNSFMCWNFDILSYLYGELDEDEKSTLYRDRYLNFRRAFQKVFYVKKESGWYDYNLKTKSHNFNFYPSSFIPLFTHCYHSINLAQSERIFRKMDEMGVFDLAGGIPTSLNNRSLQQWDFPNGWPPLNHMIIEGLRRSESPSMQQKAFWLAEKWVLSNYRVFVETRAMWEKYNVVGTKPDAGSGGEYDVQAGFGWTNGAILDLLSTYSDRMHFEGLKEDPDTVAHEVINNPQTTPIPVVSGVAGGSPTAAAKSPSSSESMDSAANNGSVNGNETEGNGLSAKVPNKSVSVNANLEKAPDFSVLSNSVLPPEQHSTLLKGRDHRNHLKSGEALAMTQDVTGGGETLGNAHGEDGAGFLGKLLGLHNGVATPTRSPQCALKALLLAGLVALLPALISSRYL